MKLEITIPVLNEEETIIEKISEMEEFVAKNMASDIEVGFVIADNGSTDRTSEKSHDLLTKFSNLEYIRLPEKGVGLALRTSWGKSTADYVGYMDLDIATDLSALKQVAMEMRKGTKVINGSRLLKESKVNNRTLLREITSRGFNILLKCLLRIKFTDGMCGFKFFECKTAQNLMNSGIDTKGWFFSTEMLTKAYWAGISILEIPVIWTDDRKSKVKVGSLSWEYFKSILKLRKEKKDFLKNYKKTQ